ncbi:hypothetical protein SteCoe_35644 [Stentor coeruleus]|uniref:PAS domain-containing protein n=1 Tax=Stentor coeruleus TaxID=5963 RepID=A0A1R2ANV1_9CILI|nr:hypothetical protein SteCoe_37093 [Stentor coeruleus]OMJ67242.1 hypothetical protein SteCoe_35644 [Stentor coeruleus]
MINQDIESLESENSLLRFQMKIPKWKKIVFTLLRSLSMNRLPENFSLFNTVLFYAQNIVVLIQVASIIWIRDVPIQGWENYEKFWTIIEYSRLDALCVEIDLIQPCIYGTFAFYLSFLAILPILLIFSAFKKTIPKNLVFLTNKFLILADIGNNILFLLLIMVLKYSWKSDTPHEYTKNVSLNQGSFGLILSVLSLLILIFISYCSTVFTYDCKHYNSSNSLNAKTTSDIKKASIVTNYFSIILYCFISHDNFLIYRGLLLILHFILAIMYCFYLPFYSLKSNYSNSIIHIFVVVSCFLNIVGYIINSVFFCVIGLIFLFPLSAMLWFLAMKYRIGKIDSIQFNCIKSLREFELFIREKLINGKSETIDQTVDMISCFSKRYLSDKPKIYAVWVSSFYFYSCSNEKLAIIELNPKSMIHSSLEEDFQEYILKIEITKTLSISEEYQLLTKLRKFEKLKNLDKKTLISVLTFLKTIVLKNPIESNLCDPLKNFKKNLSKLINLNSKFTNLYNDSVMFLSFYASFVDNILGNREKALNLNIRKENLIKFQKFKDVKQSLFFSEENPMFITKNTGKIIYFNKQIRSFFKSSTDYFSERNVNTIFPSFLHFFTHQKLKSFEESKKKSNLYLKADIGIMDSEGFWVEALVVVMLISIPFPVFIFSFRPLKCKRQSAIIDKKGIILEITRGFAKYINKEVADVKGFNIEKVLELDLGNLKKKKSDKIENGNTTIYVLYMKKVVDDVCLRVISICKEEESLSENTQERSSKVIFDKELEETEKKVFYLDSSYSGKINQDTLLFNSKTDQEKSSSNSHSIAYLKKITIVATQCTKSIRFFKIILILSIIIITLSNISFLIFAKFSIEKQLSHKAINILGETISILASLGDISGMAQVAFSAGSLKNTPLSFNQFIGEYNKLYNLTHYYKKNSDTWSYCLNSEVLFSSKIPVVIISNKTYGYEFMTMYNYLLKTLKNSEFFMNEVYRKTFKFNDQVLFLEYNGFGKAAFYLKNQLKNVLECEHGKVRELIEYKKILIGFSIGVLAISGAMMLPFLFFTQKKMNILWNQIKKIAVEESIFFKKLCLERLKTIHKSKNYSIKRITQKQKTRILSFSYTYKYAWRLLSLFILGSSYYIISNYYFYDKFSFLLEKKPDFIFNLVNARVKISTLSFIDRNYLMSSWNFDFAGLSPDFLPISTDYSAKHIQNTEQLKSIMNHFALLEYGELKSQAIFDLFFKQVENTSNILMTGVYAGVLNNIIESHYITYSHDPNLNPIVIIYMENIRYIGYALKTIVDEAQDWSEIVIRKYLNMYVAFAIGFSVVMFILYAAVYYPFLHLQGKKVKALEYMAKVVALSNISNSSSVGLSKVKK